jgi:hypothetical protein
LEVLLDGVTILASGTYDEESSEAVSSTGSDGDDERDLYDSTTSGTDSSFDEVFLLLFLRLLVA